MLQKREIRYEIFGPFRIKRPKGGQITKMRSNWWRELDTPKFRISDAKGVYVFGVRRKGSDRILPCYVGKTEKRTFARECFASAKLAHYNAVLHEFGYRNVKPFLYLLARLSKGGGLAKAAKRDIDFMEDYLIGLSLQQNKKLRNIQKTKFLKRIVLPGMLNLRAGHPGAPALQLRATLMGKT